MPLIINTQANVRIGINNHGLENIRRIARQDSLSRLHHESEGVNSQIREQVLSNQNAVRRIIDTHAAEEGLGLARQGMQRTPDLAQTAQSGSKLIQISRKLLA